jgi:phosphate-selective porin OprO and OprP
MTRWFACSRWWRLAAVVVVLSTVVGSASAQDGQSSVLDEILRILREKGQITEEEEKKLREQAKKEESSRIQAGIDKDSLQPYLRSADGNYRLTLGGFVQFDYQTGQKDERALTGQDIIGQFLVRRARLNMTGEFFKWVGFRIEGDFTISPSLTDGYVDLRLLRPELTLRGGQFKVPFSNEELTSDLFISFVERSMVNQLAPSRDVGGMASGFLFDGALGYNFGYFNGSGQNAADTSNEKMFAGRLGLFPFVGLKDSYWLKGFSMGVNGTVGDSENGQSARGQTTARTNPRFQFFAPQPANGDRYRWGVDLSWLIGPGALRFEYAQQRDQRVALGPNHTDLAPVIANAYYITGTFVLTGEDAQLNGPVVPKRPFTPFFGQIGPGAWELALRYSALNFRSNDPLNFFNGNISSPSQIPGDASTAENGADSITMGVNWYLNSRTRMMLNGSYYWYENDLGTPFSCKQSSCGVANLRSGSSNWEIQTRLQFWF